MKKIIALWLLMWFAHTCDDEAATCRFLNRLPKGTDFKIIERVQGGWTTGYIVFYNAEQEVL